MGRIPSAKEIYERYGYTIRGKAGDTLGQYTIMYRRGNAFTLKCDTCSTIITMNVNALKVRNLHHCFCHTLPEQYIGTTPILKKAYSSLGIKKTDIQHHIENRLSKLGLSPTDYKEYLNMDKIYECVGNPPEDNLDVFQYDLYIKDGELPYPENFYWKKTIRPRVLDSIISNLRECNRNWVTIRLKDASAEDIRRAMEYGIDYRISPKNEYDYSKYIGQSFGSLYITSVLKKETKYFYLYIFEYVCSKCCHHGFRKASIILSGKSLLCPKCQSRAEKQKHLTKNSATSCHNPYRKHCHKYKFLNSCDIPITTREIMSQYTSIYSLYAGTEEYMNMYLDFCLTGHKDIWDTIYASPNSDILEM